MKIYIGNLPKTADEQAVRDLFQQYGEVTDIKLIKDRFSGELRGFGFLEMPSKEAAQNAIQKVDGAELAGNKLIVNEARPQSNRGSGGSRKSGGSSRSRSW